MDIQEQHDLCNALCKELAVIAGRAAGAKNAVGDNEALAATFRGVQGGANAGIARMKEYMHNTRRLLPPAPDPIVAKAPPEKKSVASKAAAAVSKAAKRKK